MVSPRVQEACPPPCLPGQSQMSRKLYHNVFFLSFSSQLLNLCLFHPHRSGRRTGSLTASVTSSTTILRVACPSSLPGVSFASSNLWRGSTELAQSPPSALRQVRGPGLHCSQPMGTGAAVCGSSPSQKPPHTREISFEVRFHKRVPPISDAY